MLLAYVDESFNKKYFYMVALIATPEQVRDLTVALDGHVRSLAAKHDTLATRQELHGYEVFHGKDAWSGLFPRQRVQVFREAFKIIADSGVRIVMRGLDVPAQEAKYANPFPPYTVVLTKILEKVQSVAKGDDKLALVICDEYHEDDRHRRLLTNYRDWQTPTSTSMKLDRIIDTIHFTPSHESRMIQATDMIAFVTLRRAAVSNPDPREAAAITDLWDAIHDQILVHYVWVP
ncbi:DUF3800 domain-containing protein [Propionibacteriaceae bacterium Y1700]|uniref:DUF3800 domain-containing protein n=1 Tax=Microlunatus sp. Y1700 TaxID=3418487 RepID=UPI003DA726C3